MLYLIYSKLKTKTADVKDLSDNEDVSLSHSGVFVVDFEHNSIKFGMSWIYMFIVLGFSSDARKSGETLAVIPTLETNACLKSTTETLE